MQNEEEEMSLLEVATTLLTALFAALITPVVCFGVGWLIGMVAKLLIGNLIVNTCLLLNIHIAINDLPVLCGLLNFIGFFFRD